MLTVGLETLQRCCRVCGTFLRTLDILISELFSWRKVKSRKTQVSQYGSLYESPRNLHCEWRWFSVWLFLKARRNDRYPHRRRVYRFSCLNILHVIGIALVFTLPFAFVLCCLFFPVFFFCQMVGRVILETTVSPPPLKKKIRSKDTRFVLLWGRCSDRKSQNWVGKKCRRVTPRDYTCTSSYVCVCSSHQTVISTRRHPAQPPTPPYTITLPPPRPIDCATWNDEPGLFDTMCSSSEIEKLTQRRLVFCSMSTLQSHLFCTLLSFFFFFPFRFFCSSPPPHLSCVLPFLTQIRWRWAFASLFKGYMRPKCFVPTGTAVLLRGTVVNRIYGVHTKAYISLLLLLRGTIVNRTCRTHTNLYF